MKIALLGRTIFSSCEQHFILIYILIYLLCWYIVFYLGDSPFHRASFRGTSVYVSNTTNILDGTLCYENNSIIIHDMPLNISTTCRLQGKYIMLYSGAMQCAGSPCSFPHCEALVYGNMFYCYYLFWHSF